MRLAAWRLLLGTAILSFGCGGGSSDKDEPKARPKPSKAPSSPPTVEDSPPEPAEPRAFPEGTRSLELIRTVGVRIEPGETAKRIGTLAIDTRVGWTRTATAKGCAKPWVEITPRGWICSEFVTASTKMPFGREVPHLERGELVPGVYGKVTAANSVTFILETPKPAKKKDLKKEPKKKTGPVTSPHESGEPEAPVAPPRMVEDKLVVGSVNVREYNELTIGGKRYWKIAQKENQYVLASAISQHRPSLYTGARLGDETGWPVPVAFVWPRGGMMAAYTTNRANGGGINRQVVQRTPLPIFEQLSDKAGKAIAYRVGETEWIAANNVRVFEPTAELPPLLEPNERWIDVDLDNQILVAFEGTLPVYATMVSTGGKDTPTLPGVYRMWLKESEADMKGLNGEDPYSVATVPWTQFFSPEEDLALHTAYWHDQFGTRRSHGCVNLAPKDARWLYFWSDPQVPPGWTSATGVTAAPGSVVRIRSKEQPAPPTKGYAKEVLEQRQQRAPVH